MSVQKAIFPGVVAGIAFLLLVTGALRIVRPAETEAEALKASEVLTSEDLEEGSVAGIGVLDLQITWMDDPALPDDGSCSVSARYPNSVLQWCGVIERYADENGLEPNLVAAVILRESNGQPDAYSKSGAVGLMQVMPKDGLASRFNCKGGPCFANRPSMKHLFDPQYNVAYGCRMLAQLAQQKGSMREALKAYGPMDVGYYYADMVLDTYGRYQ